VCLGFAAYHTDDMYLSHWKLKGESIVLYVCMNILHTYVTIEDGLVPRLGRHYPTGDKAIATVCCHWLRIGIIASRGFSLEGTQLLDAPRADSTLAQQRRGA
jgi:hypothetical protein